MSTKVELVQDVYPFGCKGDVVTLTDTELADLKSVAKNREIQGFKEVKDVEYSSDANVTDDTPKAKDKKTEDKPAEKPVVDNKSAK